MATAATDDGSAPPPAAGLEIHLVCYDLLPPSHLSSFLNFIGAGVYHTAIAITLPQPQPSARPGGKTALAAPKELEYAFGGHDQQGMTGVFSLPVGTAAQRMLGLRFHSKTSLGDAFGPEWQRLRDKRRAKAARPKPNTLKKASHSPSETPPTAGANAGAGSHRAGAPSISEATLAPYGKYNSSTSLSNASSQVTLASETFANRAMDDLSASIKGKSKAETPPDADADEESDDEDDGRRDGTVGFTKEQRRAWRILEEMKRDSDWSGTKYSLLGRNCNSFTDELTHRLTGRRAPGWINRAAWFATSLPCLVPEGWIDEADEIVEDAAAPGLTTTAPVATKPMEHRAQPMHKAGSQAFEEVAF